MAAKSALLEAGEGDTLDGILRRREGLEVYMCYLYYSIDNYTISR